MGQAKSRGTFEQRQYMAQGRNKMLEEKLPTDPNEPVNEFHRQHGTQRLATKLVQAGIIVTPKQIKKI